MQTNCPPPGIDNIPGNLGSLQGYHVFSNQLPATVRVTSEQVCPGRKWMEEGAKTLSNLLASKPLADGGLYSSRSPPPRTSRVQSLGPFWAEPVTHSSFPPPIIPGWPCLINLAD